MGGTHAHVHAHKVVEGGGGGGWVEGRGSRWYRGDPWVVKSAKKMPVTPMGLMRTTWKPPMSNHDDVGSEAQREGPTHERATDVDGEPPRRPTTNEDAEDIEQVEDDFRLPKYRNGA